LGIFENRVLKRISVPKRDEKTGEWRRLHNKELHALYSSPNIYYLGDQITKTEIGRTCSKYGEEERCIQGLGGKTSGKEAT
jgi:hypothetical protein